VVLLGAGAPIESGIEVMDGLFKLAHCDNFAQFVDHIETRDDSEQYRLLADFLQARDPAVVTPGYQALASSARQSYSTSSSPPTSIRS